VERRGIAPLIPELGIRHVSSLLDVPVVLPTGKQLSAPMNMKLAGYQNHSGPGREEKDLLSPDGLGTRFVGRSVVKIPTKLSRGAVQVIKRTDNSSMYQAMQMF